MYYRSGIYRARRSNIQDHPLPARQKSGCNMSLLSKKAVIYNCNNGDQGKVFLNGEELPQCIRCCPDKKWADIMLNDDKGRVLLNAANDHVIVVRVIGDHIEFKRK